MITESCLDACKHKRAVANICIKKMRIKCYSLAMHFQGCARAANGAITRDDDERIVSSHKDGDAPPSGLCAAIICSQCADNRITIYAAFGAAEIYT